MTSAQLVVSVNLGGSTFNNTSSSSFNDGQWHTVNVSRTGLDLSLTVDSTNVVQVVLPGPHFTLEYNSSDVFIGGQPSLNGTVIDGYHGCLQDIRLNNNLLPLSGSTEFASVTFVGGNAMNGCTIGTCSPNPCEPGNCTEKANNRTITCSCPDGRITDNNCSIDRTVTPIGVIAVVIAVSVLALMLLIAMLVGLLVLVWRAKKTKSFRLNEPKLNSEQQYEIHSNVYSYHEEGGGEADTHFNEGPVAEVSIHELSSGGPSPVSSVTNIEKTPLLESDPYPRANTPDIDCFIEDHVNLANKDITDIDSIRSYNDEGDGSLAGSLSSICTSDDEPYSLGRLRMAGFQKIADLLEPVLSEPDSETHRH